MKTNTTLFTQSCGGFSELTPDFLKSLYQNNTRDWFEDNKRTFKEEIEISAKKFTLHMAEELSKRYDNVFTGKLFRIYRDVRFSKDKTPYNPYLRMLFSSKKSEACYFFSIEHDKIIIGAGCMEFSKTLLTVYRKKIENDSQAKKLAKIMSEMEEKSTLRYSPPKLKKTPPGFNSSSYNELFLRNKGLAAWMDLDLDDAIFSVKSIEFVMSKFNKLTPLKRWIEEL